jgi:hypothetical protein
MFFKTTLNIKISLIICVLLLAAWSTEVCGNAGIQVNVEINANIAYSLKIKWWVKTRFIYLGSKRKKIKFFFNTFLVELLTYTCSGSSNPLTSASASFFSSYYTYKRIILFYPTPLIFPDFQATWVFKLFVILNNRSPVQMNKLIK